MYTVDRHRRHVLSFVPPSFFSRVLFLSLLFISGFLLSGCEQTITIDSPRENSVETTPPDLVLAYDSAPTRITATLNGFPVGDLFDLGETEARASGDSIEAFLRQGQNVLRVNTVVNPREFFFDTVGPIVHITSVEDNGSLSVAGYLEDPSGADELFINGLQMPLDNRGQFDGFIADTDTITFQAFDNLGQQSTTTFLRPGNSVPQALSVRITPQGIDPLEVAVSDVVQELDISAILAELNPIFDERILFIPVEVDALSAEFDAPDVELSIPEFRDRTISLDVDIPNLVADIEARALIRATGEVGAELVNVTGDITVDIGDGEVRATARDIEAEISGISTDINGFSDALESAFVSAFEPIISPIVESIVANELRTRMTEIVNVLLDELVTDIELDLAGVMVRLTANPEHLDTENQGLNLELGLLIDADDDTLVASALGSEYVEGDLPDAPSQGPNGEAIDLGAMISVNALNQALMSVYQAGLTEITITLSGITLGIPTDDLADEDVRVVLNLNSPPSLRAVDSPFGVGEVSVNDGVIELWGRLNADPGREVMLFTASFNADVVGEIGITDDSFVDIEITQEPFIDLLSVRTVGLPFPPDLAEEITLVSIPIVLPLLGDVIDIVPLPSLYGYSVDLRHVWVPNEDEPYIAFGGSLLKLESAD